MKHRISQCQIKQIPGPYPDQYRIQVNYKNRTVLPGIFNYNYIWPAWCDLRRYIRRNFHQDDTRIILRELEDFCRNYG